MSTSILLFGLLPLLVFVILDSLKGMKAGIIGAFILCFLELFYTLYQFGTVDSLTIGTFVLVLIFGFISLKTKNPIFFKLQPAILGLILGLILLICDLFGHNILSLAFAKYQFAFPEELRAATEDPRFIWALVKLNTYLGLGFLIHSALVAYAALKLSNWWWIIIRGIGLYVMMTICVVLIKILHPTMP
jgi:intracellular septation protein A